ncbi:hypothetical protein [Pseudonocardia humida]|uniref:Uncharacterized protein n=1 Tax=Pseudonocardia humida TaxID=2800819 RepID=A0ABT1ADM5_9PSEU|nr:hypothetical protein [Pseudonocardia humida]MCO1661103.1 hypothetical protein [Pseudonocardia humida]
MATTAIVVLVLGLVLVLAVALVVVVAQVASVLPLYAGEANALVASATATLGRFGVGADPVARADRVAELLQGPPGWPPGCCSG